MNGLERADLYDKAADYMEVHGWTVGRLKDKVTGEVCLSGAIGAIVNVNLIDATVGSTYTDTQVAEWLQATALLAEFIEPFDDVIGGRDCGLTRNPVAWNNRVAKDRYEVIDLLRHAAKALRDA